MKKLKIVVASTVVAVMAFGGVAFATQISTPATFVSQAQVTAARSTNWAGYVIYRADVDQASSDWVVPFVQSTAKPQRSATFVGVDAASSGRILEIGTNQDVFGGKPQYSAFYELSEGAAPPETAITTLKVSPGDLMVGDITQSATTPADWTISLEDFTTSQTFTTTLPYAGFGASADYIVEAPTVSGQISGLADFGTVLFDGASINGGNANLASSEEVDKVGVTNHRLIIAAATGPDADINGFQVNYCGPGVGPSKAAAEAKAHACK